MFKWIAVKNDRPPKCIAVWGYCFEAEQQEVIYCYTDNYKDEDDMHIFKNPYYDKYLTVTHWMLLPAPPNSENTEPKIQNTTTKAQNRNTASGV